MCHMVVYLLTTMLQSIHIVVVVVVNNVREEEKTYYLFINSIDGSSLNQLNQSAVSDKEKMYENNRLKKTKIETLDYWLKNTTPQPLK